MKFLSYLLILGLVLQMAMGTYAQEQKEELTEIEKQELSREGGSNARLLMMRGDYKKAKEILDQVLQKDASIKDIRHMRAVLLEYYMDEPELAIKDHEYIGTNPAVAYRSLGGAEAELKARKEYQKQSPDDVRNNAYICELEGKIEEAEKLWTSIIETKGWFYLQGRAYFYERQEMYEKVLTDLEEAQKSTKGDEGFANCWHTYLQHKTRIYHKIGGTDLAFTSYMKVINFFSAQKDWRRTDNALLDALILTKSARLKEESKEIEPIWKEWNKLWSSWWANKKDRYGKYMPYTRILVGVYSGNLKPEVMENHIKEVAKRAPYSETVLKSSYYLGKFYKINGNKDKAKPLFQKVLKAGPMLSPEYGLAKRELEQLNREK